MSTYRTPDNRTLDDELWKAQAHELVFDALDRVLDRTEFPTDRERVLEKAGQEKVLAEPTLLLRPFLETLPEDASYGTPQELRRHLSRTWANAPQAPGQGGPVDV